MPSKTIDVTNGDGTTRTIVIPDRSRFAGVKTISKTSELGDLTTQMKVTVTGTDSNGNDNSALSGTYTRNNATSLTWNQVGGNGAIYRSGLSGNITWSFIDGSDGTPSFSINVAENVIVPWQVASSFASNNVTLSSVEETITINRTAPVVTSDKAGESRPLLSKLVGGAAVAYSLRDLNDRNGKSPVVKVRRSSDGTTRPEPFTALEVSNGTLERFCGNGDGFVERWYDQSGNGSDAVQDAIEKQPKIVDSGSLVTGGIDFLDGTNTQLDTTNIDICDVSELSVFTVLTPHNQGSGKQAFSCGSTVSGSTGYGGWTLNFSGGSKKASLRTQTKGNTTVSVLQVSHSNDECLLSYVATFPNASGRKNGGTDVTKSDMVTPSNNSTTRKRFRIGCQFTFTNAGHYTKPINEIIIYTTDQTANRPAIEANLANQYGITLS
tara:strand:- start:428 stop:1738 length:1311 start_codon:yes stop_codon:yes gene_type:complete